MIRKRHPERVERLHPASSAGRVPPHDLDAEAAVLSAILLSREALDRVLELLRPEHFYSDANGRIYEAAQMLALAHTPVDIVSVASWLRDRERLAQIGGASYLAQLADATPAVAHVGAHAAVVFEKWRLRQLIATCQKVAAEGYGDVGTVQEFCDAAAQATTELATQNTGAPMQPIGAGLLQKIEADWNVIKSGGRLMGVPTGYERLDHKTAGLHAGDVTIIAARPGMGKSSCLCGIAINIVAPPSETESLFEPAVEYGVPLFSLEMPREQLQVRIVCAEARVDLQKYRLGFLETNEWNRVMDAAAFLATLPVWIDDTPGITVPQIQAKCRQIQSTWCRRGTPAREGRRAVSERRIGAIGIDYLQLMRGHGEANTREQEISEISRGLKELAKNLGVPVIALSQLNRSVETRAAKDKRPQLSDLRESGALEQDADTIIFIYRDEYYNPDNTAARGIAELIVAKQRNGPTGKVLLRFDKICTRFDNLSFEESSDYFAGGRGDE